MRKMAFCWLERLMRCHFFVLFMSFKKYNVNNKLDFLVR